MSLVKQNYPIFLPGRLHHPDPHSRPDAAAVTSIDTDLKALCFDIPQPTAFLRSFKGILPESSFASGYTDTLSFYDALEIVTIPGTYSIRSRESGTLWKLHSRSASTSLSWQPHSSPCPSGHVSGMLQISTTLVTCDTKSCNLFSKESKTRRNW